MNPYEEKITPSTGEVVFSDNEESSELPKKYRVIIHNDHYTTMEFVLDILIQIFKKSYDEAHKLMLQTHHQGFAIVGIYPKEIAETKIHQVEKLAENNEFPLRITMEKE